MLLLCIIYSWLFVQSLSGRWFDPNWSTDDALQQVFPFYSVLDPEIFRGDLIYETMRGYLAPLHWGVGALITLMTRDPIMTAHWMMLLQVGISASLIFAIVRRVAGTTPALFAFIFFLHTRHLIQRMTGGLPRGWAPALLLAGIYFAITSRHRAVLLVILAGCLLNPPAAFLVGASYGAFLSFRLIPSATRHAALRSLLTLALCAPIYAGTLLYVTKRPPEIGRMYSFSEAIKLPEFSRDGGRFTFLPFMDPLREIKSFATRTFYWKHNDPTPFWRHNILWIASALLLGCTLVGTYRRRTTIPAELWCFLAASLTTYFVSRLVAFHLYVPDRHINIPFALFWILALSIGCWRAFYRYSKPGALASSGDANIRQSFLSLIALALLAYVLYSGSKLNLSTNANFNYWTTKRGEWVPWLRGNTPKESLIAGFPTFIDPVQLFSMRKAYATSEAWHPFYDQYNLEMQRRISISLKAHFAPTLAEIVKLLEPEGVDYFVFERKRFYPSALRNTIYFRNFAPLLRELTSRPPQEYAFRELPLHLPTDQQPSIIVYRDQTAVIIEEQRLRETLGRNL